MVKEFKTIEEQIDILRSRGLKIEDEKRAEDFLLCNNYYRISGYSLTLRKNDVFSPTATFQNIMDIYNFDRELRNLLLKFLEIVEVKFKSIFAYEFSKIYGAAGYLDEQNFIDSEKYKKVLKKVEEQRDARLPHEAYLKHFIIDLQDNVPLWAIVDVLTISDISQLYAISKKDVRDAVADDFCLTGNKRASVLGEFMHSMTIIRNLCAHDSRLFNRLFERKPSLNKREKKLLIVKNGGELDNAHLYGFVLIMRRLLNQEEFGCLANQITQLCKKYPFVRMDYYGFRSDWAKKLGVKLS